MVIQCLLPNNRNVLTGQDVTLICLLHKLMIINNRTSLLLLLQIVLIEPISITDQNIRVAQSQAQIKFYRGKTFEGL